MHIKVYNNYKEYIIDYKLYYFSQGLPIIPIVIHQVIGHQIHHTTATNLVTNMRGQMPEQNINEQKEIIITIIVILNHIMCL